MAEAAEVGPIFLLLLGVDVVIGPVITFIVFDKAKKELARDLTVVVIVQASALLYGIHAVFVARPAYLVFSADRFEIVQANELTPEKLEKVKDVRFQRPPIWGPQVVAAKRPETAKERSTILMDALTGGDDVAQLPQFYVPLEEQAQKVLTRMQPLDQLHKYNVSAADEVNQLLERQRRANRDVGFLPVRGKARDLTAVMDRKTGEIVELVPLDPWP